MLAFTQSGRRIEIDGPAELEEAFVEALAARHVAIRWEDGNTSPDGDRDPLALPARGELLIRRLTTAGQSFELVYSGRASITGSAVRPATTGERLSVGSHDPAGSSLASGHVGGRAGGAE